MWAWETSQKCVREAMQWVSLVQLQENLALWDQGRIWQLDGKWGHCRDGALEIKHPFKKKKTVSLHQHSSGAHVYACLYVCSTVCRLYVSGNDACVSAGIRGSSQEKKMLSQAYSPHLVRTEYKFAWTKTLELSGRPSQLHERCMDTLNAQRGG